LAAIARQREHLQAQLALDLDVVAVANRRDGFVYCERGLDIGDVLRQLQAGASTADLNGSQHWPTALAGLDATETDVLLEVTQSPMAAGEPGLSHMRAALRRGASVATSNKWPVALAGVELRRLAREHGLGFRAESSVMSGTPLLVALTDGIGGATPTRIRGVLNATLNHICSRLAAGVGYEEALGEAQAAGLAEPDPSADVEGLDSVAKLMILSALVFDTQLAVPDVACRGLADVTSEEVARAAERDARLREVSVLDPERGDRSVDVIALNASDPLYGVEGTQNLVTIRLDPIGEVSVRGPGAGPELAGQGVFSDLLVLARECALRRR
jgi:homoserine dehydrogenase